MGEGEREGNEESGQEVGSKKGRGKEAEARLLADRWKELKPSDALAEIIVSLGWSAFYYFKPPGASCSASMCVAHTTDAAAAPKTRAHCSHLFVSLSASCLTGKRYVLFGLALNFPSPPHALSSPLSH